MGGPTLTTPRLLLRRWHERDLPAFAGLNADPRVTAFLPKPLTRSESDMMVERIEAHFDRHGFGLWAVEVVGGAPGGEAASVPGGSPCVGFVGLAVPSFQAHFTPCVEIGWRLAYGHWGRGYAVEAARAALDSAFGQLKLDEVVSFTTPANRRSWGVMERLGMTRTPADDFQHPALPEGHALRPHVLYRVRRDQWTQAPGRTAH